MALWQVAFSSRFICRIVSSLPSSVYREISPPARHRRKPPQYLVEVPPEGGVPSNPAGRAHEFCRRCRVPGIRRPQYSVAEVSVVWPWRDSTGAAGVAIYGPTARYSFAPPCRDSASAPLSCPERSGRVLRRPWCSDRRSDGAGGPCSGKTSRESRSLSASGWGTEVQTALAN